MLTFLLISCIFSQKLVVYWGQNSYGSTHSNDRGNWEKNLDQYCTNSDSDIIVLSFLHTFNAESRVPYEKSRQAGLQWKTPMMDFSYHCSNKFAQFPDLLNCPNIGSQIQKCQRSGKKILLSLGGANGAAKFSNDQDGKEFAHTIWNMFFAGDKRKLLMNSQRVNFPRPFGGAVLDGVDLDLEGGTGVGMVAFNRELKALFKNKYLITGAPQCPFPDQNFGPLIGAGWFDYLFIQFYNNNCGVQNYASGFNFRTWNSWAQSKSVNRNVKLLLGVPGSSTAASSGFLPPSKLVPIVYDLAARYSKTFYGVMLWDASQADRQIEGTTMIKAISKAVKSGIKKTLRMSDENKSDSPDSATVKSGNARNDKKLKLGIKL